MLRKETVTARTLELLKCLMPEENINNLSDLEDIAAMKLNAIAGNGTCLKDFIDIAFLSCYLSLETMMNAYEGKYATRNSLLILKALSYHHDINFKEPIQMVNGAYSWKPIEKRLSKMEKFPARIFETMPLPF